MSTYPYNLVADVAKVCKTLAKRKYNSAPDLPPDGIVQTLFDVAFHASFLTEEGRRPGFRLIYYSPGDFKNDSKPPVYRKFRLLPLIQEKPYAVSEINRLAPAAELERSLICVYDASKTPGKSDLRIWGLLDVGDNWSKFVHNEVSGGMPPPKRLTITSTTPGDISISSQGEIILTLRHGKISYPTMGALWNGAISDFFDKARENLYKDAVKAVQAKVWDKAGHDDNYPHRFFTDFLERILYYVRLRKHGGSILVVPDYLTHSDSRLTDRVTLKYPCKYDYAWESLVESLAQHRRYYDLYFPLSSGKLELTQARFDEFCRLSGNEEGVNDRVADIAKTIASLTSVDGAVVMTDKFRVIGFGGEVTAISTSLHEVTLADNRPNTILIESFGTRHRSAFRFCSSFEDSVAFVVSQDGGAKAIKRVGADVLLWPDINTGFLGL